MLKEEILNLINTIEDIIDTNKIKKKNLKKKLAKIDKLLNEPDYVDKEKLTIERISIGIELETLNKESLKLKKVLYRQKVSLNILESM